MGSFNSTEAGFDDMLTIYGENGPFMRKTAVLFRRKTVSRSTASSSCRMKVLSPIRPAPALQGGTSKASSGWQAAAAAAFGKWWLN